MTDSAAERKRDHSAVDQSSSATDEEDRGPMVIENKRQRRQNAKADSHIEWDEDEERVWKHRLKHIADLKANQTYERVQRQNVSQKILSHRWVDKPHRSRYTVRGYDKELTGSEDFYAPTPLSCLVETLLVCAERDGHTVYFGDCTDAFLQSDLLEEINVEPPAEAQEPADVVWRLHKALPGLKGGPAAWRTRIDGILGSPPLNFRRSRVDPCLWTNSEGVRIGRHMDDFIKTGPPVAVEAVTEYLERVAQLKVTGVLDKFGKQARFLGSFITKVHGGYTIQTDTETLLAGLRDLNLEHCKPSKLPGPNPRTHDLTPLEPSEHKLYRRVVGRFLHCSAHRGDFAFSLNQLCRRVQSPTVSDMQALRKLARYIKGTLHYKLNIRPRHNTQTSRLKPSLMQTGQASLTDTASQVVFSCWMVSTSLLGHEHRKRLQRPVENQSSML